MKLPPPTAAQALGPSTQVYPSPRPGPGLSPASAKFEDAAAIGLKTPGEIAADLRNQLLLWGGDTAKCFPDNSNTATYNTGFEAPGRGNPVIYQSQLGSLEAAIPKRLGTNCGEVTLVGGSGGHLHTSLAHGDGVADAIYRPPGGGNNFVYHVIILRDPPPDLGEANFPALKRDPGKGSGKGSGTGVASGNTVAT